jgi:Cytochrome P460
MKIFSKTALVGTLIASGLLFAATPGELKVPAKFQHWYLVNSLLLTKDPNPAGITSGVHLIYVNAVGFERLKRGGSEPYPDGSIFVDDLRDFSASDASYAQGARKANTIMVKDSKRYAATGGWGFQAWAASAPKTPIVNDPAKQCYACHLSRQGNDDVFSTYLH